MFGRIGVLELLLPAFLLTTTLWSMPPLRAGLICYGITLAALEPR